MTDSKQQAGRLAARDWLRRQVRGARRSAVPVAASLLAGSALAIVQAGCIAAILAAALSRAVPSAWLFAGFAGAALLRAATGLVAERAAFNAGAGARRRLRSDVLASLVGAGPALLRRHHSGELTALAVDRIEAVDGLFARWAPAAMFAIAGPILVGLAVLVADPWAALVLGGAGLLVPFAMALSGIGAAAASRRQFEALSRLQARFLDRVRGIATIVLAGRAEAEAAAIGVAADELRRRTMRVLRMAFLSSAALDLAAALALVLLALRYGGALAAGRLARPDVALFVLLLVGEFFAPLRGFAAAYQERMHALGAGEALAVLPAPPPPPPAL
ncbi:MAG: thiol reductant ABC exporter subunit CydD, partial [Rhodospirillales bacterium]|nr:thiol reductant ABC exporter subunit CydD [Rhodospirillales bacterium]